MPDMRAQLRAAGFRSIQEFRREMPLSVRGTGYASVWEYVNGKREPPPDWTRAALAVLNGRVQVEQLKRLTVADRLVWALDRHSVVQGDRKAFQRLMRERLGPGPGTSYPAMLGYFAGRTKPSVAWITEAAGLLGLRPCWLAFGDGDAE